MLTIIPPVNVMVYAILPSYFPEDTVFETAGFSLLTLALLFPHQPFPPIFEQLPIKDFIDKVLDFI